MTHLSRTRHTFTSPIVESRRWLEGATFPADRPLINVSQAAPVQAPPAPLLDAIAETVKSDPAAHLYGPVLGLPALREEIANQWSMAYSGTVTSRHVAITSGCNQAFAATIASLCTDGDEVILPVPYYFNHRMCLDMAGVKTVPLDCGETLVPSPMVAESLITEATRAIVLVTPNNPTGAEYPSGVLQAFYDLCKARGLMLIVDETYRDFDSRSEAPHSLFAQPDWEKTLVQLYSFSKAYRLTGHRVGAMVASPDLLFEAEKYLDTITICPNQIGQRAALWGMRNLSQWLAGERAEILSRRQAIIEAFPRLAAKGWKLLGCGAYFAYVEHPYDMKSSELARRLVVDASILLLPGTMFMPEGSPEAERQFRIAFANVDRDGITTLFNRLESLSV